MDPYCKMWETWNNILHTPSDAIAAAVRISTIDAKIIKLYSLKSTFAASDQILFTTPLDKHLLQSTRSKEHWTTLVTQYHPSTHKGNAGINHLLPSSSLDQLLPHLFRLHLTSLPHAFIRLPHLQSKVIYDSDTLPCTFSFPQPKDAGIGGGMRLARIQS